MSPSSYSPEIFQSLIQLECSTLQALTPCTTNSMSCTGCVNNESESGNFQDFMPSWVLPYNEVSGYLRSASGLKNILKGWRCVSHIAQGSDLLVCWIFVILLVEEWGWGYGCWIPRYQLHLAMSKNNTISTSPHIPKSKFETSKRAPQKEIKYFGGHICLLQRCTSGATSPIRANRGLRHSCAILSATCHIQGGFSPHGQIM